MHSQMSVSLKNISFRIQFFWVANIRQTSALIAWNYDDCHDCDDNDDDDDDDYDDDGDDDNHNDDDDDPYKNYTG